MKTTRNLSPRTSHFMPLLMLLLSTVHLQPSTGLAQGTAFTYQGRLNANGNAANGDYDLRFAVFDAASGGAAVAGPLTNAATAVSNGTFSVTVDFGGGVFGGSPRWLEIAVRLSGGGPFTPLAPRQQLTPTPYAIFAAQAATVVNNGVTTFSLADGAVTTPKLGNNAVTRAKVATNQVVTSVNALRDDVTLLAGTNVLINVSTNMGTNTITISAGGGGGGGGNFWNLVGNVALAPPGNFLGSLNNVPLELWVNGSRALRLEPTVTSPNVIGGNPLNVVGGGAFGATIGGGGNVGGGRNAVNGNFGTIAGGEVNTASAVDDSIGGGVGNLANGAANPALAFIPTGAATVGGGNGNAATKASATVSGGNRNSATEAAAVVAGGLFNAASNYASTVSGGGGNTASAQGASVGGGFANTAAAPNVSVGGGFQNTASGDSATIAGGYQNSAPGFRATIAGGTQNSATNIHAVVGGGQTNLAGGAFSAVGGGFANQATGRWSFIGGGEQNAVLGDEATVGGGAFNGAEGELATVAGGNANRASGRFSTVAGGIGNHADEYASFVGGGADNVADGDLAAAGGGAQNHAAGYEAVVGGGESNYASGTRATVPGGFENFADGTNSFAAGQYAGAAHNNCFVWADGTVGPFSSTHERQFLILASGGVGINTSDPQGYQLNVAGRLWANSITSQGLSVTGAVNVTGPGSFSTVTAGQGRFDAVRATNGISFFDQVNANVGSFDSVQTGPLGTVNCGYLSVASTGIVQILNVTGSGTFGGNVCAANINCSSDRNLKEDFAPVNSEEILSRVVSLPVTTWKFKADSATTHLGPTAQDFYSAFNVGTDDKHIAPIDEGGVALAAIQGLNQKLTEELKRRDGEIEELRSMVTALQSRLDGPGAAK